jgi:hypothetical protein
MSVISKKIKKAIKSKNRNVQITPHCKKNRWKSALCNWKVLEDKLKIQRKINRLVKTIKKMEIPSIPKRNEKEKLGKTLK